MCVVGVQIIFGSNIVVTSQLLHVLGVHNKLTTLLKEMKKILLLHVVVIRIMICYLQKAFDLGAQ